MEPKARNVLIGTFTLVVIIGIMLTILWLGKLTTSKDWNYFHILFKESVSGLSQGSDVQYSGVKIGEVVSIHLDKNNPNNVDVRVKVDGKIPVKQNVEARLSIVGITGQSVVSLSGGSKGAPNLQVVDGKEPVIVATPSAFSALFSSGGNMMTNISEILVSVHKILDDETVEHIHGIIGHTDKIMGAVASQDESIKDFMKQLDTVAQAAGKAMASIDSFSSSADRLLNREGQKMIANASNAMETIQKVAKQINTIVEKNGDKIDEATSGTENLGAAITEFRNAVDTINNVFKNVEENPAGYLLNGSNVKEYKP